MQTTGETAWKLVPLHGAMLVAYRVYWSMLAAATLFSFVQGYRIELAEQRSDQAFHALGLLDWATTIRGEQIRPFAPETKASLVDDEALISVNGVALPADTSGMAMALEGPDGGRLTLLFERPDGTRHLIRVARHQSYLAGLYARSGLTFTSKSWIIYALGQATILFWILTSVFMFVRRPRDPVCAMLAVGFMSGSINFDTMLVAGRSVLAAHLVVYIISYLALTLGLVMLPDGVLRTRALQVTTVVACATTVAQAACAMLSNSPLLVLALAVVNFGAIVVAVFIRYRSTPPGPARQQIKFVVLGCTVEMVFLIVARAMAVAQDRVSLIGPGVWLPIISTFIGAAGGIALASGLLVALLRYRLYDAESVITRSVAYGALTLILVAIFAGSEKIIEEIGRDYFGQELGALAAGLGAAVAAIVVTPLHHRITHWAEQRFQGALVQLRHGLPELVGDLQETATPAELADMILMNLENGVRARHGAVVSQGDIIGARDIDEAAVQQWLSAGEAPIDRLSTLHVDRDDPVFPMRVPLYAKSVGLIGWILLGPRPDGSFYGKDEREALLEISGPVARALMIATTRQKREALQEAREANRDRKLIDVQKMLTNLEKQLAMLQPARRKKV